jgi:hypothetical protein
MDRQVTNEKAISVWAMMRKLKTKIKEHLQCAASCNTRTVQAQFLLVSTCSMN